MEDITVIGMDIAKNVFHVCGMNSSGKIVIRKRLYRNQVLGFFVNLNKCVVALESCGGSSYWAREIKALGHDARLIPAQHVKAFVKGQKNDNNDAEAIAEAALRPTMRFVTPNTVDQQDIQSIHRFRERLVKQRNALCNQARGLLMEYGLIIPQGRTHVVKALFTFIATSENAERDLWNKLFTDLKHELQELDMKILEYERLITKISRAHPVCKKLEDIHGVGPLTSTAIIAAVGNPTDFKNGRQFAAWLGLVPKQHSSGGKTKLLGITKKGDKYLRKLLVHGARTECMFAKKRNNTWLMQLKERRGYNKAAVAYANKNARHIWRVLADKEKLAA